LAIAITFAAILVYSFINFAGLARYAWPNQFTETMLAMQRVHYEMSESARLYPSRVPHRLVADALSSLRFLCQRYQREVPLLQTARDQIAPMRPRLDRLAEYMTDACSVEPRLNSTASAMELEQAGSDFRTNLDRALQELSSAVMEHGSLSSDAARRGRSLRLFELGVISVLMLGQLGWLWWWRRGGSRGPREAVAPGTAPWMRLAVEAVPDGILMADATGRIRSANPAAERLLGYGRGGLTGLALERVVPGLPSFEEQPHGFVERAKLAQPNGSQVERRVSWFRRRGQSASPALIFLQPVTPPATPSKADRKGLMDAETVRQLEDQILLVSGYSEIAAANLPEQDPVREDLEQLARAAAYATLLCRQAATAAPDEPVAAGSLLPMALNPFAATLAQRVEELLEAGTEVTVKADPVAGSVSAQAEMVELALLGHLVRNVELSKAPRQVIIATELSKLAVTVRSRGTSPTGWATAPDSAGSRVAELLAAHGVECRIEWAQGAFRIRLEWPAAKPGSGTAAPADRERGLALALTEDYEKITP